MQRIYEDVGSIDDFFWPLPRALGEARHSGGKNCHRRARLVVNVCGWNSVQPAIRLPFDHDYYFGFSCGAGRRNHFDGDLRHTKKPSAEPANSPAIPHTIASSVKA